MNEPTYCKMLVSVSSGDKHAPEMQADKSCGCIPYIFKYEILLELLGSTCGHKEVRTPVFSVEMNVFKLDALAAFWGEGGCTKLNLVYLK